MKKLFLLGVLFSLLFFILVPKLTTAWQLGDPLVPNCTGTGGACTIADFFTMLNNIYSFIVFAVATPLAILMLTIGGVMIMVSAGDPKWLQTGKNILWVTTIGLVLVFCSWLVVNFILGALGYQGAWNVL